MRNTIFLGVLDLVFENMPNKGGLGVGEAPASVSSAAGPTAPATVVDSGAREMPNAPALRANGEVKPAATMKVSPSRMKNPFFHSVQASTGDLTGVIDDESETNVGLVLDDDESEVQPKHSPAASKLKVDHGALSNSTGGKGTPSNTSTAASDLLGAQGGANLGTAAVAMAGVAPSKGSHPTGIAPSQNHEHAAQGGVNLLLLQQQQRQRMLLLQQSIQSHQQRQQQRQQHGGMQEVGSSGNAWGQFQVAGGSYQNLQLLGNNSYNNLAGLSAASNGASTTAAGGTATGKNFSVNPSLARPAGDLVRGSESYGSLGNELNALFGSTGSLGSVGANLASVGNGTRNAAAAVAAAAAAAAVGHGGGASSGGGRSATTAALAAARGAGRAQSSLLPGSPNAHLRSMSGGGGIVKSLSVSSLSSLGGVGAVSGGGGGGGGGGGLVGGRRRAGSGTGSIGIGGGIAGRSLSRSNLVALGTMGQPRMGLRFQTGSGAGLSVRKPSSTGSLTGLAAAAVGANGTPRGNASTTNPVRTAAASGTSSSSNAGKGASSEPILAHSSSATQLAAMVSARSALAMAAVTSQATLASSDSSAYTGMTHGPNGGGSFNALRSLMQGTNGGISNGTLASGGDSGSNGIRENRDSFNSLIAATVGG